MALQWEEVETEHEKAPLAVDWQAYRNIERSGALHVFLMRWDGVLVGYTSWFVQPLLHHALTRWAICDAVYLDPAYRKGFAGVFLIRESEKKVRDLGAKVVTFGAKAGNLDRKRGRDTVAPLLAKLGYRLVEEVWSKYV